MLSTNLADLKDLQGRAAPGWFVKGARPTGTGTGPVGGTEKPVLELRSEKLASRTQSGYFKNQGRATRAY